MGLFNIIGSVAVAAVKVAVSPVAIAVDVVDAATGGETTRTKDLLESIVQDAEDVVDELTGEK